MKDKQHPALRSVIAEFRRLIADIKGKQKAEKKKIREFFAKVARFDQLNGPDQIHVSHELRVFAGWRRRRLITLSDGTSVSLYDPPPDDSPKHSDSELRSNAEGLRPQMIARSDKKCAEELSERAGELTWAAFHAGLIDQPIFLYSRLSSLRGEQKGSILWKHIWNNIATPSLLEAFPTKFRKTEEPLRWPVVCQFQTNCELLLKAIEKKQPPSEEIPSNEQHLSPTGAARDNHLSENQKKLLSAMYNLRAFNSDKLVSLSAIAVKADCNIDDYQRFKQPMKRLKDLKLVEALPGRNGGYWLISKGKEKAKKLAAKDPN
jgi:hypothetical protein